MQKSKMSQFVPLIFYFLVQLFRLSSFSTILNIWNFIFSISSKCKSLEDYKNSNFMTILSCEMHLWLATLFLPKLSLYLEF